MLRSILDQILRRSTTNEPTSLALGAGLNDRANTLEISSERRFQQANYIGPAEWANWTGYCLCGIPNQAPVFPQTRPKQIFFNLNVVDNGPQDELIDLLLLLGQTDTEIYIALPKNARAAANRVLQGATTRTEPLQCETLTKGSVRLLKVRPQARTPQH